MVWLSYNVNVNEMREHMMTTVTAGPPAMSSTMLTITKGVNVILSLILRSGLHTLLSKRFMLLSFTGRKSGKKYTVFVGYQRDGDLQNFAD